MTSNLIKTIDYTFGHDELHQTVKEIDASTGDITSSRTDFFLHDGHGDVRALLGAAGAVATIAGVEQAFYYDAYGQLVNMAATAAATTLLYSGEQTDALTGQQYLRARYYNPNTGQFNRLDDFFGNHQDPQSFHKYAYVHGDPVNLNDPTGLFASLGGFSVSVSIGSQVRASSGSANTGALNFGRTAIQFIGRAYRLANNAYDGINAILTAVDLLTFDPTDLLEITRALPDLDSFIGGLGGLSAAGAYPDLPNQLIDSRTISLNLNFRGKLDKIFRIVTSLPRATERIGEFGAALIAGQLGFEPTELQYSNTGIDAVLYNDKLDTFMVLEAKGSQQRNRLGKLSRGQMNHRWIQSRLRTLIERNMGIPGTAREDASALQDAVNRNKPIVASVVSLNIRAGKIRFGAQLYQAENQTGFERWRGF